MCRFYQPNQQFIKSLSSSVKICDWLELLYICPLIKNIINIIFEVVTDIKYC